MVTFSFFHLFKNIKTLRAQANLQDLTIFEKAFNC